MIYRVGTAINSNMRCIEILDRAQVEVQTVMINSNMRCIEILTA